LEESYNGIAKRRTLPPTLEKAAAGWLEGYKMGVATNTAEIATLALKHLLPEFGSRLLCDIAPNDVRAYQQRRLREGAAGRTVNIETGTLRQILRVNNCWQGLDGKVKALRENKDVGRCLSPDEEERLLAGARTIDSACYTVVTLALNTALRKSEIRLLRWSQIDFARRVLTVGKSKTDAGTGRLIPLNFTAFEVLAQWAKRSPEAQPEHFVFPWCENRRIDATRPTRGWRTAWKHALRNAGVTCRFHDLRHTAISKLAESQASEATLLSIAGHVSRKMLEHYSHIRLDAKREALDSLVGTQKGHQLENAENAPQSNRLN
jgi:integrase